MPPLLKLVLPVIRKECEDMKQINIQFAVGNGQKIFPVFYAVENREEDCLQIFRCSVALPDTQRPSWLCPSEFELVTHIRDGVQMVDYNASAHQPCSLEEEWFRYKVYAEILFQEMRKRSGKFPQC